MVEYRPTTRCGRIWSITTMTFDSPCRLILTCTRYYTTEVRCPENLCALVTNTSSNNLRVGIRSEKEDVAFILLGWRCIIPITIDVDVLVVETGWWIVPFGTFDRIVLVADIDQVQPVHTRVQFTPSRYGVQFTVGQFVVDENPVVVLCHLDIDDTGYICVIGRHQLDIVWFSDI